MNDADLEMLELEAVGDAIWKAEQAGRCCHTSAKGFRAMTCTSGCGQTWASEDEWLAAMDEAIAG